MKVQKAVLDGLMEEPESEDFIDDLADDSEYELTELVEVDDSEGFTSFERRAKRAYGSIETKVKDLSTAQAYGLDGKPVEFINVPPAAPVVPRIIEIRQGIIEDLAKREQAEHDRKVSDSEVLRSDIRSIRAQFDRDKKANEVNALAMKNKKLAEENKRIYRESRRG